MKAVILAGGFGTRLSEETEDKPKPMVEVGEFPILWHILKIYSYYGINDFIICLGYKGYIIKEYFSNYYIHSSDVEYNLKNDSVKILNQRSEPWTIKLIDTGLNSMTGGRLKRVSKYLNKDEDCCFTYGDGLSNVNIKELIKFHKEKKVNATVTAVNPPGRFGAIEIEGGLVSNFKEKPVDKGGMINGGFFVLNSRAFKYIKDDLTVWEQEPLENLSKDNQLAAFIHNGFWQPMDTLRDKKYLDQLWISNKAPWKLW